MAGAIVAEQHHERERQGFRGQVAACRQDLAAQKRMAEVEARLAALRRVHDS